MCGFATAEAWRAQSEIRQRVAEGDLDPETGARMIEDLISEFVIDPPPEHD